MRRRPRCTISFDSAGVALVGLAVGATEVVTWAAQQGVSEIFVHVSPSVLTNGDLARVFREIGDMLEIKGEVPFKVGAYRRAADTVAHSPVDLVAVQADDDEPLVIPLAPELHTQVVRGVVADREEDALAVDHALILEYERAHFGAV